MGRRLPPLKTLPAFEIAADRLSFSAAAEELHVTHGAVSRQIQALEDYLGVALFRSFNRRIELTAAGLCLLSHVPSAASARGRRGSGRRDDKARVGRLVPGHIHDALADPEALRLQRCAPGDRGAAVGISRSG